MDSAGKVSLSLTFCGIPGRWEEEPGPQGTPLCWQEATRCLSKSKELMETVLRDPGLLALQREGGTTLASLQQEASGLNANPDVRYKHPVSPPSFPVRVQKRGHPVKRMLTVSLGKPPPYPLNLGDNLTSPPSSRLSIFRQGQALRDFHSRLPPPHADLSLFYPRLWSKPSKVCLTYSWKEPGLLIPPLFG